MRLNRDGLDTILADAAGMLRTFSEAKAGRQRADWNKGAVESGLIGLGVHFSKVSARAFWGESMLVDMRDVVGRTIFWDGVFEPEVCSVANAVLKDGGVAIDVGSHIGFQALYFSKLVGNGGVVVSFEPSDYMFTEFLNYNLRLRGNVRVTRAACWHTSHLELDFHEFAGEFSAYSGLFDIRTSKYKEVQPARSYKVKTKSIDLVRRELGRPVDFVKIDAESAEMAVLKGMKNTIESDYPAIIIEMGDFDHLQESGVPFGREILQFLADQGYIFFTNDGLAWQHHNIQSQYDYCNIFAVAMNPGESPPTPAKVKGRRA